ncbi:MAG: LysR family transcriptional regulator [Albidovulum sp.]|nr:LysR family transcriptional regulator [Albidovulum sp.]
MDTIDALKTLNAVVEHGSFSAAARRMRVNRSVVSRGIEALEVDLGIRLLNRTTRSLSLTEAGRTYYEGAKKLLADVDALKSSVVETENRLKGTLRISAPIHFGEWQLWPIVQEFLRRHQNVNIRLELSNQHVDVVGGGFDLVIRSAPFLDDSTFVARRISTNTFSPCAAPSYCARNECPKSPDDLSRHSCVVSLQHAGKKNWRFKSLDGSLISVPIEPRLSVNAGSPQIRAIKEGLGIGLLPDYVVSEAETSGELVRLLPDYTHESYPIYVIYPHRDLMPLRTRNFLNALVKGQK